MRKIGCCLNMLARTPDGIGLENLSVVSKFPFDFIELPMAQLMAVPPPNGSGRRPLRIRDSPATPSTTSSRRASG
jgi:hypothetical protein